MKSLYNGDGVSSERKRRTRGWGSRSAPVLLRHVTLLLAIWGGAGLATGARLKWDPSTYVPLRELFPAEYWAAAVLLPAGAGALLVLGHLVLYALRRRSRALLLLYAAMMMLLMAAEGAWATWTVVRVMQWLISDDSAMVRRALKGMHQLKSVLSFIDRWFHIVPAAGKIKDLIKESEEDLPRNLYVVAAAAALLAALQVTAVALALLAARHTSCPGIEHISKDTGPARWTLRHGCETKVRGRSARVGPLVQMFEPAGARGFTSASAV